MTNLQKAGKNFFLSFLLFISDRKVHVFYSVNQLGVLHKSSL